MFIFFSSPSLRLAKLMDDVYTHYVDETRAKKGKNEPNEFDFVHVFKSSHPHRSLAPYSTLNVKYLPKFNEMQTNSHIFFSAGFCVCTLRWKAKWSSFVSTKKKRTLKELGKSARGSFTFNALVAAHLAVSALCFGRVQTSANVPIYLHLLNTIYTLIYAL